MTMPGERSFSIVFENIVDNVQGIIRSEVRLAKAELREETVKAGKAAGIAASGAVLALYAVGFMLLACLYAIETAVAPWLAALIVTIIVGTIAVVLIKLGVKRLKRVDPRPDRTINSIKENLEWAKTQVR
jgi:uncharacterized membrane protein YqjE